MWSYVLIIRYKKCKSEAETKTGTYLPIIFKLLLLKDSRLNMESNFRSSVTLTSMLAGA
jgi:hypothetical protein